MSLLAAVCGVVAGLSAAVIVAALSWPHHKP